MRPHGGRRRCHIGALSAALTLGLAAPAPAAPPTFSGPTPFDAGTSPSALTAADLNADGRPDLAMVDQSASGTGGNTVLMNATAAGAGTPSFTGPVFYGAFDTPISITAADVDGDTRPDLITADITVTGVGGVAVLRNATTPGATTADFTGPTPFDGGESPRWVAGADLNADGKPDIIVANTTGPERIAVLLNTTTSSTPSFSGPTTFEAGAEPRVAVAIDVNLDGRPDIAVANVGSAGPDGVSVLLNTTAPGAGTPSFDGPVFFDAVAAPQAVAAADFNGDGKPDLVTADGGADATSVLVNTTRAGARSPSFADPIGAPTGTFPRALTTSDVNSDGKPDVITADTLGDSQSVLINVTEPGAELPAFAAPATFASGDAPDGVTAADLNGDGRPDLATGNGLAGSVNALLNTTPLPLTAGPSSLAFGSQPLGTIGAPKTVTLENSTAATLPVDVRLSGAVGDMLISRDTCGDGVPANGSCAVALRFAPSVAGARAATLTLDPAGPQSATIPLTGTGGPLPQGPPGATGATGAPGSTGAPGTPAAGAPAAPPRAAARATCKAAKPKQRTARKRVTCRVRRANAGAAWRVARGGRTRAKGTLRSGTATLRLRLAPGRYTLSIAGRRAASFRVRRA